MSSLDPHDRDLSAAFDGQAARFERAPVQTDAAALARLVSFANLPPNSLVADAGCGPGLVAAALLAAGHRVHGFDLSAEMVARARARNATAGDRAVFEHASFFDAVGPFDAVVSRYVVHHVQDAAAFVKKKASVVRPGGVVIASDHTTDADPDRARWHQDIERRRDRTHTSNLTDGQLVDAFALAGLRDLHLIEEPFELDFDEWFDRGTPSDSKANVQALVIGGSARGFAPALAPDGVIRMRCVRALVRGTK
jgi:SAM-dependent methyltransferase